MKAIVRRVVAVGPAALATFAAAAGLAPAVSGAAECGPGTVYDAPSNMCVAAPAPPRLGCRPTAACVAVAAADLDLPADPVRAGLFPG